MKKVLYSAALAYLTVLIYMIIFNTTEFRTIPLHILILSIVFFTSSTDFSLYTALFMGLFFDIHFLYIGPTIAILLILFLIFKWLYKNYFSNISRKSSLIIITIIYFCYFILAYVFYGTLVGFTHYNYMMHNYSTIIWIIVFFSIGSLLFIELINRYTTYRHGRH